MNGNLIQVFALEENLYVDDAPIIIRAGGIFKDAQTGRVFLNLRMHNISNKAITYVKAKVVPFDPMKNPLSDALNIEYLDLAVLGGKKFGDDITFSLPNPSTRSFNVIISAIAFADGTTWAGEGEWTKLSPDAPQMEIIWLEPFKYAVSLSHSTNAEDITKAIEIFESLSGKFDVRNHIWSCQRKLEEMQRKADEKAEKKKHTKKTCIIIGAIVLAVVCIVSVLLIVFKHEHEFGGWETLEYPTLEQEGKRERYCDCGEKETDRIAKLIPSEGLEFQLNDDNNSYTVVGIGSCTDVDLVIPDVYNGLPVTKVGGAFGYCQTIQTVTIPDSVRSINAGAFWGCTSLTSVYIPNSVTYIGMGAFLGTSLTSINIPDSVTSIGVLAFSDSDSITSINVDKNNQYYKSIDGNLYSKDGKTLIQYALGKKENSFVIPDSVKSIGEYAFTNCTSLESIIIPDSVTSIGFYAFKDCTSLTSINYGGTKEQWNKIDKSSTGASESDNFTVYCTDGNISREEAGGGY